jgi:DNA-binding transcriptional regulator YdaS (Cro superfamily)
MERELSGIDLAVKASAPNDEGTQAILAEKLGVSQQAVSEWVRQGWAPAGRVVEIEMLTGVSRTKLLKPVLINSNGDFGS